MFGFSYFAPSFFGRPYFGGLNAEVVRKPSLLRGEYLPGEVARPEVLEALRGEAVGTERSGAVEAVRVAARGGQRGQAPKMRRWNRQIGSVRR